MSDKTAILELLADGNWWEKEVIVSKTSHTVTPERALRLRVCDEHIGRGDLEQRVRKARRRAILNRLCWMRVSGILDQAVIDGMRHYRIKENSLHGCKQDGEGSGCGVSDGPVSAN